MEGQDNQNPRGRLTKLSRSYRKRKSINVSAFDNENPNEVVENPNQDVETLFL